MSGDATSANTDTRVCPTCNGTGINPVANYMLCPKCNGEKRVPLPAPTSFRGSR